MDAVLVTVTGDTGSIEVRASPTVPLVTLIGEWAPRCSTHPATDLTVLSVDLETLLDPAATLGALGIGAGAAIRLVTGDEAMSILDRPSTLRPSPVGPTTARYPAGMAAPVPPPPSNRPPAQPSPAPPDRPRPEGLLVRPEERRAVPVSPASLGVPAPPARPLDLDRMAPPVGSPYAAAPPPPPRAAPSAPAAPGPSPAPPASLGQPAPAPSSSPGPPGPAGAPESPAPSGGPQPPAWGLPPSRPPSPPPPGPASPPPTVGPPPAAVSPLAPTPSPLAPEAIPSAWPPSAPSAVPPSLRPAALDTRSANPGGPVVDQDEPLPGKVSGRQRLARALKAGMSRSAAPRSQPGEFARAAAPKAGERYRLAMQETDRIHNLETMVRAASLRRCTVIAVVSPKGGAGKTTMTALLGMLFAELRRDPVLALDANPDFGNLRDKLLDPGVEVTSTDDLSEWLSARPNATPADLSSMLGAGPHGLRLLPTPTGSIERMVKAADFDLYRDLIARLRDYEGIILVDCGTGLLDPPVRAALGTADQIVLVTDSSADTARLVVTAAQYLPADTPTWLVANKMPDKGAMVDLDQVAAAIPQLRGVTVVPEQRLSENIVTPAFDWSTAPDSWKEPVREVAARLANNWRTLR